MAISLATGAVYAQVYAESLTAAGGAQRGSMGDVRTLAGKGPVRIVVLVIPHGVMLCKDSRLCGVKMSKQCEFAAGVAHQTRCCGGGMDGVLEVEPGTILG
jgi:hypothetical protein